MQRIKKFFIKKKLSKFDVGIPGTTNNEAKADLRRKVEIVYLSSKKISVNFQI